MPNCGMHGHMGMTPNHPPLDTLRKDIDMSRASALEQVRIALAGRDFERINEITNILLKQGDIDTINRYISLIPVH